MNKPTKARRHNSSILQRLLSELTPLEMEQTKVKMQLAARIEDLAKTKGWNKSQLAAHLGKNPSEITKWLSGTQNFTIDILTEISVVFGVELASLFNQPKTQVVYKSRLITKIVTAQSIIPVQTPIPIRGDGPSYSDYFVSKQSVSTFDLQDNPA